jgi:hypothetical protein
MHCGMVTINVAVSLWAMKFIKGYWQLFGCVSICGTSLLQVPRQVKTPTIFFISIQKHILLLQISSHDFEPIFIIFCLNWRILPGQPNKNKTPTIWHVSKHLSLLCFWEGSQEAAYSEMVSDVSKKGSHRHLQGMHQRHCQSSEWPIT